MIKINIKTKIARQAFEMNIHVSYKYNSILITG